MGVTSGPTSPPFNVGALAGALASGDLTAAVQAQVAAAGTATPAPTDTLFGLVSGALKRFAAHLASSTWLGGLTGETARALYLRLSDVISVKDFGAKGDSVTDDTTALLAAFAFQKAVASRYAGGAGLAGWIRVPDIYVPAGQYPITSPIPFYDHFRMRGDGASNHFAVGSYIVTSGTALFQFANHGGSDPNGILNFDIRGIGFSGRTDMTTSVIAGDDIDKYLSTGRIEHCGFIFLKPFTCSYVSSLLAWSYFQYMPYGNFSFRSSDGVIIGNYFNASGYTSGGVNYVSTKYMYTCDFSGLSNCEFTHNYITASDGGVGPRPMGIGFRFCEDNKYSHNKIDLTDACGVQIQGSQNIVGHLNHYDNCCLAPPTLEADGTTSAGPRYQAVIEVEFSQTDGVQLEGEHFSDITTAGIATVQTFPYGGSPKNVSVGRVTYRNHTPKYVSGTAGEKFKVLELAEDVQAFTANTTCQNVYRQRWANAGATATRSLTLPGAIRGAEVEVWQASATGGANITLLLSGSDKFRANASYTQAVFAQTDRGKRVRLTCVEAAIWDVETTATLTYS